MAKLFSTKTFLIIFGWSIVSSALNLNDDGIFETIGKKTCVNNSIFWSVLAIIRFNSMFLGVWGSDSIQ